MQAFVRDERGWKLGGRLFGDTASNSMPSDFSRPAPAPRSPNVGLISAAVFDNGRV